MFWTRTQSFTFNCTEIKIIFASQSHAKSSLDPLFIYWICVDHKMYVFHNSFITSVKRFRLPTVCDHHQIRDV